MPCRGRSASKRKKIGRNVSSQAGLCTFRNGSETEGGKGYPVRDIYRRMTRHARYKGVNGVFFLRAKGRESRQTGKTRHWLNGMASTRENGLAIAIAHRGAPSDSFPGKAAEFPVVLFSQHLFGLLTVHYFSLMCFLFRALPLDTVLCPSIPPSLPRSHTPPLSLHSSPATTTDLHSLPH